MRSFLTVPVIVVLMVAVIVQVELRSAGESERETEELVSQVSSYVMHFYWGDPIFHLTNSELVLVSQCVNVCETQQSYMVQSLHLERMQCS